MRGAGCVSSQLFLNIVEMIVKKKSFLPCSCCAARFVDYTYITTTTPSVQAADKDGSVSKPKFHPYYLTHVQDEDAALKILDDLNVCVRPHLSQRFFFFF